MRNWGSIHPKNDPMMYTQTLNDVWSIYLHVYKQQRAAIYVDRTYIEGLGYGFSLYLRLEA